MAYCYYQRLIYHHEHLQAPKCSLPTTPICSHPVIYSGDFNSRHKSWGYTNNDPDGAALHEWASNNDLNLLYNPKQSKTFHSAIWNTFTNADLTFYSADANNLTPHRTQKISENFPRSQHRPAIITHPSFVEYTPSTPIPRWNFNKAHWEKFTYECGKMCEDLPPPDTDINNAYTALQRKLIGLTKKCILRGFCSPYIPGWDEKCEKLANEHAKANSLDEKRDTANKLLDHINNHRRSKWISTVEEINMKHSIRKPWSTINKLTGKKNISPNPNNISPNAVASCLLKNGKFQQPNKEFTTSINWELKTEWKSPSVDRDLCGDFTADELHSVINLLKPGKAPGPDNLTLSSSYTLTKSAKTGYSNCCPLLSTSKKFPRSGNLERLLLYLSLINRVILPAATPGKPLMNTLQTVRGTYIQSSPAHYWKRSAERTSWL